jgi:DNA-binding beta-propeller fold protein YncE
MMRRSSGIFAKSLLVVVAAAAFVAPAVAGANPSIPGGYSPDGLIWLPSYGEGSVQLIDPVEKKVVDTIPGVADHPIVAKTNADRSYVFVNSFGPLLWNVNVIDTRTRSVVKVIPTVGGAYAVTAMSHDQRYLYVPTQLSLVQVIDTVTLETVRVLPALLPPFPAHMEVTGDDKSFIVLSAAGFASKYDAVTGVLQAPPLFLYGFIPGWGALSVHGDRLYSVNNLSGITVVDTDKWYVEKTMFEGLFSGPISATLTPDGKNLWVCNFGDGMILDFDVQTGALVRKWNTNGTPIYVGFSADGSKAYVSQLGPTSGLIPDFLFPLKFVIAYIPLTNTQGSTLDVYDTETATLTDQIPVASAPIAGMYPA